MYNTVYYSCKFNFYIRGDAMRKFILLVCLLSVTGIKAEIVNTSVNNTSVNKTSIAKTSLAKTSLVLRLANGVKHTFKAADSFLNYILTGKGAIKTIIFASPLVYLYCKERDINPIKEGIASFIRNISRAKKFYEIQVEIGNAQAFTDTIKSQPKNSALLMAWNTATKVVKDGVPFVASIWLKNKLEVKK